MMEEFFDGIQKHIYNGHFEQAISAITEELNQKKEDETKKFALNVMRSILNGDINYANYLDYTHLNFNEDYISQISELLSFHSPLCLLEDTAKKTNKLELFDKILLQCVDSASIHIQKNSNNYPHNSINGKIWMDGESLRMYAHILADIFKREKKHEQELQSLLIASRLSCAIMSHYPNLVGPDMVDLGKKYEELGNISEAKSCYTAVVLDFTLFLEEMEDPEIGPSSEDKDTVESLINALEGLRRINENIDNGLLERAKDQLIKITNNDY